MSVLANCNLGVGKRALVVDDEPVVGQIICRVLEQMGYQVDHALDGDQALDLGRSCTYAVVICDILMPRTNGMTLYDTWCREAPEVAANTIFVTGDTLGGQISDFISRTGCPCIYKPFRLNDLAQVVLDVESAKAI